MNPITKELLEEKYNIHEGDEEMYYMKGISSRIFAMWPYQNGDWMFDYNTPDDTIIASTVIRTEDELITALKFSKLI